jgi:hypothetical protein
MKKIILGYCILLFSLERASAQKIDSVLNILSAQAPGEKVYIHYDKDYYVAGETMWLKAYLYSDGKPSGASNNLYIQVINSKGVLIDSKRYPIMGAVAKGNIDIPDTLPQGNYYVRVFTPQMLNDDEAFIYKKAVYIFNPKNQKQKETVTPNISLQFFPESGTLVDGLITVVAFKATDQSGLPVAINGSIKTEDGTTIVPFKSFHDGIGKFQFKPMAGKKYLGEVETTAGVRAFPLPAVMTSGINLKVQDEKGGKLFQLQRTTKDKEQFENLLLVAQLNNRVVYETEITFEDYPSVKGHLVTDSLPSGILHFTVFNKQNMPLAERLSFVDNHEYLTNTSINIEKQALQKRAENSIELSFADAVQRSCSIAITDANSSMNNSDNIISRFLLTSDLKGYIYNPAWYFENSNDSTQQGLDNLMLTHGWSRFSWTKVFNNDFAKKQFMDQPLVTITGVVKDDKEKENMNGGMLNVYLQGEDSSTQSYEVDIDNKGNFVMDSLMFSGKAKLFYTYSNSQGKIRPAHIILDAPALAAVISTIPTGALQEQPLFNMPVREDVVNRSDYVFSNLEHVKELEKVTLQSKSNKKPIDVVNEKYTTGVFRSMGKVNLDNINQPANDKSLDVVDYVKNSIQQIEIQGGRFVNRKNMSLLTGQKWPLDIFLNEAPASMLELKTLRVDQVALIKFYEAGFVGSGSSGPGGAIAVYTKEISNNNPLSIDKWAHVEYNGYSITKEFYNPDYNAVDAKQNSADNRTTLYWNPDVYAGGDTRSIKINFFNNDFSKKLKVTVEGFDAMGKLIHYEKIIGQ